VASALPRPEEPEGATVPGEDGLGLDVRRIRSNAASTDRIAKTLFTEDQKINVRKITESLAGTAIPQTANPQQGEQDGSVCAPLPGGITGSVQRRRLSESGNSVQ
jgi:hypothetical protein